MLPSLPLLTKHGGNSRAPRAVDLCRLLLKLVIGVAKCNSDITEHIHVIVGLASGCTCNSLPCSVTEGSRWSAAGIHRRLQSLGARTVHDVVQSDQLRLTGQVKHFPQLQVDVADSARWGSVVAALLRRAGPSTYVVMTLTSEQRNIGRVSLWKED